MCHVLTPEILYIKEPLSLHIANVGSKLRISGREEHISPSSPIKVITRTLVRQKEGRAILRRRRQCDHEAGLRVTGRPQPRKPDRHWQPEVAAGTLPSLQKRWALLTLGPLFSGLQDCERICICCFKPLSLWTFVRAAAGRQAQDAP